MLSNIRFDALQKRWKKRIKKFVLEHSIHTFEKEDLTQEFLIVLFQCFQKYRPGVLGWDDKEASFGSYFYAAMLNRYIDLKAYHEKRQPVVVAPLYDFNEGVELESHLSDATLRTAIVESILIEDTHSVRLDLEFVGMPEADIQIVERRIDGYTYTDISEDLSLSRGRVYRSLKQSQLLLRRANYA